MPQNRRARSAPCVLVLSDNEEIRSLVGAMLITCGYRMLLADKAELALSLIHKPSKRIDLAIVDICMTGVDAAILARKFQAMRPRAGTLFLSRLIHREVVRFAIVDPVSGGLREQGLVKCVRQALDTVLAIDAESIGKPKTMSAGG